nr:cytochrome P450 87A3-like [Ipomoea batatas]
MLGMRSCEIPACYNQLQETPKQQTVIKVQEQLITSVAPLWTQGKAFNMNFQVENLLTEATPNKHSLLPIKTLVEIKSQPECGVKATHFNKSQHQPPAQEAGTQKCLKRKEPDYYSDEGWVRRFIDPGDENIKEGENDCEDIMRYAGPVVNPKPFMLANEFYWLLGVDSRDLNGEAFAENVIIQGETKAKVKSANSKHKARSYHCKEEFIINREAMIVFRKEHVPTKISHRLSPKKYGWRNPKCKGLLPPGSMGFPIIGESIQFFTSHSLQGIPPFIQHRMTRYGSVFRTSIVGQKVIVSTDPEINHFIFQQEGELVHCWYTESATQITGPQGFTVHHGESHKYLRNLALNLVGPENLKETLLTEMDQTARQHLDQWTALSELDIKQATEIMLFKLAASKVLSYDEKKAMELRNYYKAFMEGFISFPLYVPGTSFYASMQGRKNAVKLIKETLNERRSSCNKKKNDFLDYILSEVDKEETFLTEKIAVDVICLLIFAAYETTSSAITLVLKFLNQHPHILKQLQEEHENIIASREDKESTITWKEYRSMKFTHMVINETVRLANIAPGIFRKVVQDFQIKGKLRYTIPKGWMFMICPSSVHLSAEKYDDPLSFNPSRWNLLRLLIGCIDGETQSAKDCSLLVQWVFQSLVNPFNSSLPTPSKVSHPSFNREQQEVNHFIFQQEGELVQCWYSESSAEITGRQGFLGHHGDSHKYIRNLAHSLVGPENLKQTLLAEMDKTTRQHLDQWTGLSKLDIKQATEIMLFKLAASKVLSYDEKKALELRKYYKDFHEGFISFPLFLPGTSFYAAMQGHKHAIKLIKETLKERRSSKKGRQDYLDFLINEVDKEDTFITEEIAVDIMCMLIFAAYETTSSAITLALKFLNQHPHVLKQLQEEHEKIVASRKDKESSITWKEYKSMKFTHMVINETVRLANIVPGIFRKVIEDFQIKGKWKVVDEGNIVQKPGLAFLDGFKVQIYK